MNLLILTRNTVIGFLVIALSSMKCHYSGAASLYTLEPSIALPEVLNITLARGFETGTSIGPLELDSWSLYVQGGGLYSPPLTQKNISPTFIQGQIGVRYRPENLWGVFLQSGLGYQWLNLSIKPTYLDTSNTIAITTADLGVSRFFWQIALGYQFEVLDFEMAVSLGVRLALWAKAYASLSDTVSGSNSNNNSFYKIQTSPFGDRLARLPLPEIELLRFILKL